MPRGDEHDVINPEGPLWKRRRVLFFGLLAVMVLTALLYLPKYTSFFTRDDFVLIDYAHKGLSDVWSTSLGGYFIPVLKLSFLAMVGAFGRHPVPYHVVNMVIHLANILLLALFISRLTRSDVAAVAGAAVFGLSYPAYEAVSWITCIVWELIVLFFLAASLSYFAFRRGPPGAEEGADTSEAEAAPASRKRWWLYGLSIISTILALLTKEAFISLPVLLLLLEVVVIEDFFSPGRWKRMKEGIKYLIPFFAITVPYAIVQVIIQAGNPTVTSGEWSLGAHVITNVAKSINWLFLVPPEAPGGAAFFEHGLGKAGLTGLQVAGYVIVPLVFLAFIIRGNRVERFAVGWIIITLIPVAMFVGNPPSRYTYLPTVGFALLFGEVLGTRVWAGLAAKKALRAVCAGAMVLFIVISAGGLYLGARRFANRTNLNRNIVTQLEELDGQYGPGQGIKLTSVPHVLLDQNGIISTVNLYCENLRPAQDVPSDTPEIVVYRYTEPDGRLQRVR